MRSSNWSGLMGFTMPSMTGLFAISSRPPKTIAARSTESHAVCSLAPTGK